MKKAYYTKLNVASLNNEFVVNVDGVDSRISIEMHPWLAGFHKDDLVERLYQNVRAQLGHEDFLLIPSPFQAEMDAMLEDRARHPHKYPMGGEDEGGMGIFGGGS